jgi:Uma2 family endonuclease
VSSHNESHGGDDATNAETQPEVPGMSALLEWMMTDSPVGITAAEYEAMDEEICRRIEVVDGRIFPMPSPSLAHQTISYNLRGALRAVLPTEYAVTNDVDVRLRDVPLLMRKPDVTVFRRDKREESALRAYDVVLAIEGMSPGSMTTDRNAKPAEYAQSGIPYFWRVEQGGDLALYTYALVRGENAYKLTGIHTLHYVTDEPFELNLDIQALLQD